MELIKQQFRINYEKGQELRYTANLDVHKIWERYFRRADIPLAYSKGFHPQPRINQALPLPLGMLSDDEWLDFWTESAELIQLNTIEEIFRDLHQPGIHIIAVREVNQKEPSLQSQVKSVKYRASRFYSDPKTTEKPIPADAFLSQETIMRTRRNKEYDLRPLILNLEIANSRNQLVYEMHLTALPGKSGRPDEVLAAMGHDPNHFRITRTEITFAES